MAITSNFNKNAILNELRLSQEKEYVQLIERGKNLLRKFLSDARGQPQGHALGFYYDDTKKLRKSIAAYIFRDGRMIWSDEFGNVEENRMLIRQDGIVPRGLTFIAIAGKYYASFVEVKGYNVISTQGSDFKDTMDLHFLKMKYGRV